MTSLYSVIEADSVQWCRSHKGEFPAIVTGLPDMSETSMNEEEYILFLREASNSVLQSITPDGYAIFIQTDRKHKGVIDKSYYISDEAIRILNMKMVFHKIALIRDVDMNDLFKPTYSHILCYTRSGKPGVSTPDVLHRGKTLYENGAGDIAVKRCLAFLRTQHIDTVVDPYVGRGTTLICALQMGFTSCIGVDIDPLQCMKTKRRCGLVRL